MSGIAFTLLLFVSSFVTTYLISGTGEESYFTIYPWETFREVVRSVVCALTDLPCDEFTLSSRGRRVHARVQTRPPTMFNRFVRRLLLGLPTVGAGSLISTLFSLPFPITHWIRVRLRRGSRNASDITTLIFLTVVIIGAARCVSCCIPRRSIFNLSQSAHQGIPIDRKDSTTTTASR